MSKLKINIATWNYDRCQPIIDGRVAVEGCEVNYVPMSPQENFRRNWEAGEFEVAELGLGSYTIAAARGQAPYVAVPVFLSRMFRHNCIFIRTDKGIATPADLNGKTIGVLEYQNAAGLWARGMLMDEYGFKPETCLWRQGGLDQTFFPEKMEMNLPAGFRLEKLRDGETLNKLFRDGALDAIISPLPPAGLGDRAMPVRRLFEDFAAAEKAYYAKTKIYPVMHALGIRNDVHAQHPWLATSLYKAFCQAKAISQQELTITNALKIGLPWLISHVTEAKAIFGDDIWPYGIKANRLAVETLTRYSFEQGQAVKRLTVEEMFVPIPLDGALH